jgi:hypothetical protein
MSPIQQNAEVEMAVCEWLRMQEPDFSRDGNFKIVPIWTNDGSSGLY